jgi:hypothetical protein
VYPVDKIVQGLWKNFLPLLTAFLEIINNNFSKGYKNAKFLCKGTKPLKKYVFSSLEGEVFPIFSTKAVKKIAKPLFFCYLKGRVPSAAGRSSGPATCRVTL